MSPRRLADLLLTDPVLRVVARGRTSGVVALSIVTTTSGLRRTPRTYALVVDRVEKVGQRLPGARSGAGVGVPTAGEPVEVVTEHVRGQVPRQPRCRRGQPSPVVAGEALHELQEPGSARRELRTDVDLPPELARPVHAAIADRYAGGGHGVPNRGVVRRPCTPSAERLTFDPCRRSSVLA